MIICDKVKCILSFQTILNCFSVFLYKVFLEFLAIYAVAPRWGVWIEMVATVTPAAVEEYFNVYASAYIDIKRGCCVDIAVKNISTQAINVANPNLIVERVA